jgi:NAD+ kinase
MPADTAPLEQTRVVILAAGDRPQVQAEAGAIREFIGRHAEVVAYDDCFSLELDDLEFDLAVVLGGDGSILRSARLMGYRQRPVVGVNLGTLGFLADLLPQEFGELFPRICRGEFRVVEHLMFETAVLRDGEQISQQLGLNETAILRGDPFSILEVDLYVDTELVTTYSCDGVIIATPVGSTAHSLSAGGPILRKDLQAFVVSPISPHTLTNRPVVDSAKRVFELSVRQPTETTTVVVDGRVLCRVQAGDRVRTQRAQPRFMLVEVPGHGYYRTLREKLGWGGELPVNRSGAR